MGDFFFLKQVLWKIKDILLSFTGSCSRLDSWLFRLLRSTAASHVVQQPGLRCRNADQLQFALMAWNCNMLLERHSVVWRSERVLFLVDLFEEEFLPPFLQVCLAYQYEHRGWNICIRSHDFSSYYFTLPVLILF